MLAGVAVDGSGLANPTRPQRPTSTAKLSFDTIPAPSEQLIPREGAGWES